MPSGYQANVVAGAPILSTWGNTIRDRSVMVFDTAAQRDTQLPAPTEGMVCYIVATKSTYVYDGTAWRGHPRGRIGFIQLAATFQTSALSTWQTAYQVAVTVAESRLLKVEGVLSSQQVTNAASVTGARLARDGNNLAQFSSRALASAEYMFAQWSAWLTLAAGTSTFAVQLYTNQTALRALVDPYPSSLAIFDYGTP